MRFLFLGLGVLAWASAAGAAETITYTHDAQGRVTKVKHTGTVNHNLEATYAYDKADNRTQKKVTGSPNPPPP